VALISFMVSDFKIINLQHKLMFYSFFFRILFVNACMNIHISDFYAEEVKKIKSELVV